MALVLSDAHAGLVGGLEPELRMAAEAIGMGLRDQLARLAPALSRPPEGTAGELEATLVELDLDREGPPDAVSLCACVAAHRAYVAGRGRPQGVSAGALALARLLVWAQRAALLGPAPRVEWLGPAARAPETGAGRIALAARCALSAAGRTRRAEAVALIAVPAAGAGAGPAG